MYDPVILQMPVLFSYIQYSNILSFPFVPIYQVTRKYFDMMHELAVPTPIHFKTLADSCQGYEPGKEFEDFVRFQQSTARCAARPFYEFQQCGRYW
jgi:hypothetical protein